ncbi:MAG: DMT family transporter [Ahrensia sp.]|nr:DMT family transporter [Ahrensia sp.]
MSTASATRFAILCALGSALAFTVNDTTIKFLSGNYALHQLVLIRAAVAIIVTLAFFVPLDGGLKSLRITRPLLHLARGMCVVFANMAFFMSLATIKIAEATAILFIAPLIITALAVIFLGENVGPRRWIAILVGLLGVFIMVRPGAGSFQAAALLPLVAAIAYAMLHVLTRKIGTADSAAAMAFYIQLTFIVVCSLIGLVLGDGRFAGTGYPSIDFVLRAWIWPPISDWGIIALAGLSSAVGGYLVSQAYRLAPASIIAPFEYAALPLALVWGLLIFGEWPDWLAWIGMALIIASGLYAYSRERVVETVDPKPVQRVP